MLSYFQATVLGLVQGVTELFPISSLGHSVVLPTLLGWQINQSDPLFLTFLVATHFATSLVLIGFYFADWVLIVRGILRSLARWDLVKTDSYAKLGWLIIVATIPPGILGLIFEKKLSALFASPRLVAGILVLNGIVLLAIEIFGVSDKVIQANRQTARGDIRLAKLTWMQALKIGVAECLALIPGFSRTGMTLGGGLFAGLDHNDAARFSFLLATPIIFSAAALKLPSLAKQVVSQHSSFGPFFIGAIMAALGTYFSVRFLTRYFKNKTLTPFAVYCIAFGLIALGLLFAGL
jgi:undecaprenyl-diphosphatase